MGEVYRANDLIPGQPVALKFLPVEMARDEQVLKLSASGAAGFASECLPGL